MKVIDFHVHTKWSESYPLKSVDGAGEFAEKLVSLMDEQYVEKAVVLPISPFVSNEYVADAVELSLDRLIGFTSVQPNLGRYAVEELEHAIDSLGLRGLKIHPGMQGFSMRDPKVWQCIRRCGELGVPVVIHCLMGDYSALVFRSKPTPWLTPARDYALLPYFCPETTSISAHMGGLLGFEEIIQCTVFPNVYLETSYSIAQIAKRHPLANCIKMAGSEKFIFGSDLVPGLTPQEFWPRNQIEIIEGLELGNEEKTNILYNNAKKMLKL